MNVSIRLLRSHELDAADHIFRLAFGTFVGLAEPTEFYGDATYIPHRWKSVAQGMSKLIAGVNTSRDEAYRQMLARGFCVEIIGVAMQKPNEPGYNRPDVFAIDDWR